VIGDSDDFFLIETKAEDGFVEGKKYRNAHYMVGSKNAPSQISQSYHEDPKMLFVFETDKAVPISKKDEDREDLGIEKRQDWTLMGKFIVTPVTVLYFKQVD